MRLLTSTLSIAEVAYIASDQHLSEDSWDEAAIDELWTPNSPIELADFSRLAARSARSILRNARETGTAGVCSADAIHLATSEINDCDRFYTYESEGKRIR